MSQNEQQNSINPFEDTAVILILVDYPEFKTSVKQYNMEILGKTMLSWVKNACFGAEIVEVKQNDATDILSLVKSKMTNKKYTAIFYSDTPLLTRQNFADIMEYTRVKNLSVVKLTRGYIFENEYAKTADKVLNPQPYYFEEEDFITCYNFKQYSMISDILKNRILYYHMKNGVMFLDTATTYIDADVNIGKNVVIAPNNTIKGESYIGDNVCLGANNIIENSAIMDFSKIESSTIKNSIVGKNVTINPYCFISEKSIIGDGAQIKSFVSLIKTSVAPLQTVKKE